jgi:hypothetical protein
MYIHTQISLSIPACTSLYPTNLDWLVLIAVGASVDEERERESERGRDSDNTRKKECGGYARSCHMERSIQAAFTSNPPPKSEVVLDQN